jgi:hypothetical protein
LQSSNDSTYLYGLIVSAMANYTLGHNAESQRALDEIVATRASSLAYQIAEIHAWRGERDQAFEWLERARRQHDGGLTSIKVDRSLVSLRNDPRYHVLLRELKLPD